MKFFSTLGGLAVLLAVRAGAGEAAALTLPAALAEAAQSNAELRVFQAHVATMNRGVAVAARYPFNPELVLAAGIDYHAGISHAIEWPGKRTLREALARHDVAAAEVALAGFQVALAAEVRAAYSEALAARALVRLAGDDLQAATTLAEAAQRRVAQGFAPPAEELKARVELINARRQQQAAEKDLALAGLTLNQLLGRTGTAPAPDLAGELTPDLPAPALEHVLALALAQHPDLRLQQVELGRAATRVEVARKERGPDITAEAFYEQDSRDSAVHNVGFGLNVPLPLWQAGPAGIAGAQVAQAEAGLELEKKRREIGAQVTRAHLALTAARKDLALFAPELFTRLDDQCRAAQARYAAGEFPLLTLLDLQQTRRNHRKDYTAAVLALHRAWAELETAAGVSLEVTK